MAFLFACSVAGTGEELQNNPRTMDEGARRLTSAPENMDAENVVPDQVIVKFSDGTDMQTIRAIQAEIHLETIKLIYKPAVYLMKILDGSTVETVIERLKKFKEVKYSEPNYTRKTDRY